jgi:hypothetical protein
VPPASAARRQPDTAARPQTFLLQLMLASDRARRRVQSEGTALLFASATHREVAEHLLAVEGADGGLPEQLLDGLPDGDAQALLSGLILAEHQESWADDPERIFSDCRRAVLTGTQRLRLAELQELVRTAEQAGDHQAAEKYLNELVKTKKNL